MSHSGVECPMETIGNVHRHLRSAQLFECLGIQNQQECALVLEKGNMLTLGGQHWELGEQQLLTNRQRCLRGTDLIWSDDHRHNDTVILFCSARQGYKDRL